MSADVEDFGILIFLAGRVKTSVALSSATRTNNLAGIAPAERELSVRGESETDSSAWKRGPTSRIPDSLAMASIILCKDVEKDA